MEDARLSSESGFTSKTLDAKKDFVQQLFTEVDKLSEAFNDFPEDDPKQSALYALETIKPLMETARDAADRLEGIVDRRLWPIPTYSEMLHEHM